MTKKNKSGNLAGLKYVNRTLDVLGTNRWFPASGIKASDVFDIYNDIYCARKHGYNGITRWINLRRGSRRHRNRIKKTEGQKSRRESNGKRESQDPETRLAEPHSASRA